MNTLTLEGEIKRLRETVTIARHGLLYANTLTQDERDAAIQRCNSAVNTIDILLTHRIVTVSENASKAAKVAGQMKTDAQTRARKESIKKAQNARKAKCLAKPGGASAYLRGLVDKDERGEG